MSLYWELVNKEPDLLKDSYTKYRQVIDLAVESWDSSICTNYFTNITNVSTLCVAYKIQSDIALKQALTSILMREYAQAIYDIRLACENLVIAIYGYADPDALLAPFEIKGAIDQKVRKEANTFLESKLPTRSAKFRDLHKTCDAFGSHQSIGHLGRHFNIDNVAQSFTLNYIGSDSTHLTIGLVGIIIGVILEFHFAILELPEVEWLKVKPEASAKFSQILNEFEAMKRKYRFLWENLQSS